MPVESGSMYLGGSMPRRADIRVATPDKASATDYNHSRFDGQPSALCRRYPTLRKPALTADFTYENFCEEAAEELLRVKDLEKRPEYNNLMAE